MKWLTVGFRFSLKEFELKEFEVQVQVQNKGMPKANSRLKAIITKLASQGQFLLAKMEFLSKNNNNNNKSKIYPR